MIINIVNIMLQVISYCLWYYIGSQATERKFRKRMDALVEAELKLKHDKLILMNEQEAFETNKRNRYE